MVWQALVLVLLSVPLHAGWNLLARRQRAEGAFVLGLLRWVVLVGFIPAVIGEIVAGPMPGKAWVCVVISGCCCGLYFYFLVKGYGSSDFTVVYPIARSLPVLLIGLGDVLRGRSPSAAGWAGMSLVVVGCLLAPLVSFGEIHRRRYWNWSSLWLLLTALGTVGYSLSDKVASEVVAKGPASAARYAYFFFLGAWLVYSGMRFAVPIKATTKVQVRQWEAFLGGLSNYLCYWMVLWAYQMVDRASYIVAFRQFSIVLGVVAAFAIYKERGVRVRVTASVIITIGLVLIGLWG